MERKRSRYNAALAAAVAAGALLVAACSAPGSSSEPSAKPGSTKFKVPSGPVTLVVDDIEGASRNAAMVQLNKEFMAKYPNITVKRIKSSFDAQQTKQPLTLSGPNPPDVVEIAVPNDAFSKLATSGQLLNLDAYAKHYGWVDRFVKELLDQSRFNKDGQILSGPLYGVYQVEDIVGVYYNKKSMSKLGLSVPTSYEDFVAALAAAKSAGEVPMMLGNLDGWPAGHVYSFPMNKDVPAEDINGWTFHTKKVDESSKPFLDATAEFQQWGLRGYFEKDFNAVSMDDAVKRFAKGEALFLPAGTWNTQQVQDLMGDNAGFFMVGPSSGGWKQVLGGQGQFWSISGKSKNQAAAAAYLDFMTSQRGGEILIQNGSVPGFRMASTPSIPAGVFKDVFDAIELANKEYAYSTFMGITTPTNGAVSSAGLQKLLTNRMTPEQYVRAVQDDYTKYWNAN